MATTFYFFSLLNDVFFIPTPPASPGQGSAAALLWFLGNKWTCKRSNYLQKGHASINESSAAGNGAEGAALGAQVGLEEQNALKNTSAPFARPWGGAASCRGFGEQLVAAWQGKENSKE